VVGGSFRFVVVVVLVFLLDIICLRVFLYILFFGGNLIYLSLALGHNLTISAATAALYYHPPIS
jgi:hypothetical protein